MPLYYVIWPSEWCYGDLPGGWGGNHSTRVIRFSSGYRPQQRNSCQRLWHHGSVDRVCANDLTGQKTADLRKNVFFTWRWGNLRTSAGWPGRVTWEWPSHAKQHSCKSAVKRNITQLNISWVRHSFTWMCSHSVTKIFFHLWHSWILQS